MRITARILKINPVILGAAAWWLIRGFVVAGFSTGQTVIKTIQAKPDFDL